jgi:6-pyruvoyltetrahydropterin/6-carboxytetrahydropterin synthase
MFGTLQAAYGDRIIPFTDTDPTTEVLARTFFDEIARRLAAYANRADTRYKLRPNVRLIKVRVWETSSSWAEYQP